MTNTQLRIVSALVLVAIVLACMILGQSSSLILVAVLGILVIDEIIVNFLGQPRNHISYLVSQVTFISGFGFFNFIEVAPQFLNGFVNTGVFINLLLLVFLFFAANHSKFIYNLLRNYTYLVGLVQLIIFMSIAKILHLNNWFSIVWGLIILNFTVDIFAWFFGKNFGKNKLWPAVSPKKTIEGTVGGVSTSVIVTSIYWNFVVGQMSLSLVVGFFILACFAQLGDLVQSKMKRTFEIKDSSNLIPGHGGAYDRVDSLLFVAPFFALLMKLYYHI